MSEIRVSVVGGGFKPPHQGHLDMIFDGIRNNHITIIAVGKGVRDGITRELSMNILAIYLNNSERFDARIDNFIYTPFGFIVLNKTPNDESETGGGGAGGTGGEVDDKAITDTFDELEKILVEVYDDMLVDTLLMEELHSETIEQIKNQIGDNLEERREFIIKKSNSPIGLIFFLHGELSSYVKKVSTANLKIVYYVGEKDYEARQKFFKVCKGKDNLLLKFQI